MNIDAGTIVGIIGIVIALVTFFIGKKKKKLAYNIDSVILISQDLRQYENLIITYNGETITSLCSTVIRIKNIGNDIVELKDFAPSKPLVITTSDRFLFEDISSYEVQCSNSKNSAHLEKLNDSELGVMFDFLAPKDFITITILHTGNIKITGELKIGTIKEYSSKKYEKSEYMISQERYEGAAYYQFDDSHYVQNRLNNFTRLAASMASIILITFLIILFLTSSLSGQRLFIDNLVSPGFGIGLILTFIIILLNTVSGR